MDYHIWVREQPDLCHATCSNINYSIFTNAILCYDDILIVFAIHPGSLSLQLQSLFSLDPKAYCTIASNPEERDPSQLEGI